MMRQARFRVVVADHRKAGCHRHRTLIWAASEIDLLITDKGASKTALAPSSKSVKVQSA
jgi:DeoR/GlpR family transcriptional regulator of sugar metabolism